MQKTQAITQMNAQLEQTKSQLRMQENQARSCSQKILMELEFQMNMQLKQMETEILKSREEAKEDRKTKEPKYKLHSKVSL